jgi:hypothetical protein
LNWLLDGFAKLHKNGLQLAMTPEQQTRAAVLLLSSDSPAAFVRCSVMKKKDATVGMAELYERYQTWCRKHQLQPFNSRDFGQTAKSAIEMGIGLKYRHDLASETGGVMSGWKGLAWVEVGDSGNVENTSKESGVDAAALWNDLPDDHSCHGRAWKGLAMTETKALCASCSVRLRLPLPDLEPIPAPFAGHP